MQLDFDLHSGPKPDEPNEPKIHTVTELTRRVRALIESNVGTAWVEGEISNFRRQASGHQYFTLKDATSQLPCVLFAGQALALRGVNLADGVQVQLCGDLTVYEARGQYQMVVKLAKLRGEGALQAKFEALKQKLAAEGLFDPAKKRPLPKFPRRIGVVTSPTGAALQDFLNILHRRQPGIQVLIHPVRVQGRGAADEIARAITDLGNLSVSGIEPVDVIVVTRGGGSIEDLWEFNEEAVARAIAASPLPVVSAVGHEIDFTIADFAADLRAPTPSAAAEILAANREDVMNAVRQLLGRMSRSTSSRIELATSRLDALKRSALLREPARVLSELRQRTDRHLEDLEASALSNLERRRLRAGDARSRLAALSPTAQIARLTANLEMTSEHMGQMTSTRLAALRAAAEKSASLLHAFNPEAALARGYTITMDEQGRPLTSKKDTTEGSTLKTRFSDGEVRSVVSNR